MKRKLFNLFALLLLAVAGNAQVVSEPYRLFPKTNFRPPVDTALTPVFVGEIRYKTSDGKFYKSVSLTGAKWAEMFPPGGADGTETIVTAGTNVTVTGLGSVASPYVINATGGGGGGGLSVTNESDNRVITSTGSGTGNAEANLTFDGSTLTVTGAQTITGSMTASPSSDWYFFHTPTSGIMLGVEASNAYLLHNMGAKTINVGANGSGDWRFRSTGEFRIEKFAGGGNRAAFFDNDGDMFVGAITSAVSSLTSAVAGNSIDHANYQQDWTWNSLNGTGMRFASSSTATTASGISKLMALERTGTNANSAVKNYNIYSTVNTTGTTSENTSAFFGASLGETSNTGVHGQVAGTVGAITDAGVFGETIKTTGSSSGVRGYSVASGDNGYAGNFVSAGTATNNIAVRGSALNGTTNYGAYLDGTQYGLYVNSGTSKVNSFTTAISLKSANYTATIDDYTILVDASGGAVTITLPAGSGIVPGRIYVIVKTDSSGNAVIIDPAGADTINGASSISITTQWGGKQAQALGGGYVVIGSF